MVKDKIKLSLKYLDSQLTPSNLVRVWEKLGSPVTIKKLIEAIATRDLDSCAY